METEQVGGGQVAPARDDGVEEWPSVAVPTPGVTEKGPAILEIFDDAVDLAGDLLAQHLGALLGRVNRRDVVEGIVVQTRDTGFNALKPF